MIKITASGNIGKDAEIRKVTNDHSVVRFSIASNKKYKDKTTTTWLDCQKWNSEKLAQYLTKGTSVVVHGDLEIREHEGKYYTTLNVQELEFGGGGNAKSENRAKSEPEVITSDTFDQDDDPSDDLPF